MLPELQAEQQLRAIEAASIPHLKLTEASRILARWRSIGQRAARRRKPPTREELLAELAQHSTVPVTVAPARKRSQRRKQEAV